MIMIYSNTMTPFGTSPLQGMYKGSEPIRLQHVLWMVRSRSEICPKFPKFPNLVRSSSIVFIEILLIFDNLSYFGVFLEKKNLEILGTFFVCKQTSDE